MQILMIAVSAVLAQAPAFAAPAADAKKLLSECYDGNSAKACLSLAEKLGASASASASDHERSGLARRRACTLGETKACGNVGNAATTRPQAEPPEKPERGETLKIKRSEVETRLANLAELLQGARLEGHPGGGFEFVQLEPGSAYETLGFRLRDVLLEINGHVLESSAQAMELFVLLRSETDFKLKLKRAGQVIERKYEIKE